MNKKECSLVFTGDIGFDKYMSLKWRDENLLSPAIIDFCKNSNHVIANVEGAVIDANDNGSHGVFFHSINPEATCVLKKIHADIWNISNNHIMDAGLDGLVNTKRLAKEMSCQTIGAGINEKEAATPVYLEEAGGIGMFGVAYMTECIPAGENEPGVFRWDNLNLIQQKITEIKNTCRWCIIVSHGGEEFADLPNPYTRDRYLKYLEMGADIVVAHHPHVPENYELFDNNKAIFYSLGNFIFDTDYQRAHPYTDIGVILKLILTKETLRFEALGTKILRGEERIIAAPLPDIFENVDEAEYALLSPLASYVFLEEERKKMIYLEPERFVNASDETWDAYFYSTEPDGYDKGAHMDLSIIAPFSKKAEAKEWQKSKLDKVKKYILRNN